MVKEIIVMAFKMLGLQQEAYKANGTTTMLTDILIRFVNFTNHVLDEIATEYFGQPPLDKLYEFLHTPPHFEGVSNRVIAYGVAAEHCITEGMEEAVTWDKRYKDALAAVKRKNRQIKGRKFL